METEFKTCRSCRYFDSEYEMCRFNPPVTNNQKDTDEIDRVFAWWPRVDPTSDYCGQWIDLKRIDPMRPTDPKWK